MLAPVLTFIEQLEDNEGGVDGLDGAQDLVISPDGKHLYTIASLEYPGFIGAIPSGQRLPITRSVALSACLEVPLSQNDSR
ncbi:MAG: hypothetical protein ACR2NU_12950 [Aeoliella sp.]